MQTVQNKNIGKQNINYATAFLSKHLEGINKEIEKNYVPEQLYHFFYLLHSVLRVHKSKSTKTQCFT